MQIFSLCERKTFPFQTPSKEKPLAVCLLKCMVFFFSCIFYAVWLMRQRQKVLRTNNFGLACRTKPKGKHRPDEQTRPPLFQYPTPWPFSFYLLPKEVGGISLILFLACNVLVSLLIAHTWPGVFWRYWCAVEYMSCIHNGKAYVRSYTKKKLNQRKRNRKIFIYSTFVYPVIILNVL